MNMYTENYRLAIKKALKHINAGLIIYTNTNQKNIKFSSIRRTGHLTIAAGVLILNIASEYFLVNFILVENTLDLLLIIDLSAIVVAR